jgi:hypothetical protein
MELTELPLLVAGSREETIVMGAFYTQCGRPRSTDD